MPSSTSTNTEVVSVVDDEESVRESLPDLLRQVGSIVQVFSSAEAFLASDCVNRTACLVLDIAMPGMTGLELQRELLRAGRKIPLVFVTAHFDVALRQRVLELGAVACLFKPFSESAILTAVNAALRGK